MTDVTPLPRVREAFPYPIARPYVTVFDPRETARQRRRNLCFTVYQLLRMVCLPLVCQYLRGPSDEPASRSGYALNRAVGAIGHPFFSDWINLLHTLRAHLPAAGVDPIFPQLGPALDALGTRVEVSIDLRGDPRPARLTPFEAILGLRNGEIGHGLLDDETAAARHLDVYVPVLQSLMTAFDFLGDVRLVVRDRRDGDMATALRGAEACARAVEPATGELGAALARSSAVLVGAGGPILPLFPLLHTPAPDEPIYLYDGHVAGGRGSPAGERGYIDYTGVTHRTTDAAAYEPLAQLLSARRVTLALTKERTAPWTIAANALDYSRDTLNDLTGVKYFPECYEPWPALDQAFAEFLQVPDKSAWPGDAAGARYANGLILTGGAGAGKTAFLAHQVGRLLPPPNAADTEPGGLVLFLRGGDLIGLTSVFEGIAEKLGIATAAAQASVRGGRGFSGFRELCDLLHRRWYEDRVPGRRLLLAFDALDEAPSPEAVLREALEMIRSAARYPWLKIIVSVRQEWLAVWTSKLSEAEKNPLDDLRHSLYVSRADRHQQDESPVVTIEPLSSTQAGNAYARYQRAAAQAPDHAYAVPACTTPWAELPPDAARLLTTPLYLHLFMEVFDGGPAAAVHTVPELFRRVVDHSLAGRDVLKSAVSMVAARLLAEPGRSAATLTSEDAVALRRAWAEGLTADDVRHRLSPVEALAVSGLLVKQRRREGGGYRFVFQPVGEYLLYRELCAQRDPDEDELGYWRARAAVPHPFAEYRGAFGFLFRDWVEPGSLHLLGPLVEAEPFPAGSPHWLLGVLAAFLVEQARADTSPGRDCPRAAAAANALRDHGQIICGVALFVACRDLVRSRFARAACVYAVTSVALLQSHPKLRRFAAEASTIAARLLLEYGEGAGAEPGLRNAIQVLEQERGSDPNDGHLGRALADSLNALGLLMQRGGRPAEAEALFRRSARVSDEVAARDSADARTGMGLTAALNNLAVLLREQGRTEEAGRAIGRAVDTLERLRSASPHHAGLAKIMAEALNTQGFIEMAAGRLDRAEGALAQAVALGEAARTDDPEDIVLGDALCAALENLGVLFQMRGKLDAAESTLRRSVETAAALWKDNPAHVQLGESVVRAGVLLGDMLGPLGRFDDAADAYRQAVAAAEARHTARAGAETARALVHALCGLGDALDRTEQVDAAADAWQRCIETGAPWWQRDRRDTELGSFLGQALSRLGVLVRHRQAQPQAAIGLLRQAVDVFAACYDADQSHSAGRQLASALDTLGDLLLEAGAPQDSLRVAQQCVEVREKLRVQTGTPPQGPDGDLGLGRALNHLAVLLARANRARDAERAFRRAIEVLTPRWAPAPDRLAAGRALFFSLATLRALLRRERRGGEAARLEPPLVNLSAALVALLPDDPDIISGHAYLLYELGRTVEAERLADAALARWPTDPGAREVKQRIEGERRGTR